MRTKPRHRRLPGYREAPPASRTRAGLGRGRVAADGGPDRVAAEAGERNVDRIETRAVWLLVALLLATPPAAAEIFKCTAENGMDRYQNFPCAIDSIGSLPSGSPTAGATSVPRGASVPGPAATPVAVATAGPSAHAGEPRIGMTEDEVRAAWGEPDETEQDEPRDGRIEIWRYRDGRFVQFGNKHRVLVVQR
jgi:hypothetical protein